MWEFDVNEATRKKTNPANVVKIVCILNANIDVLYWSEQYTNKILFSD